MNERLTDRARKVLQLSNQEAQRFSHEYIGTEHILLGLVKEGSGTAAEVLKRLGIDLWKVRLEVETIVQAGPDYPVTARLPSSASRHGLLTDMATPRTQIIEQRKFITIVHRWKARRR